MDRVSFLGVVTAGVWAAVGVEAGREAVHPPSLPDAAHNVAFKHKNSSSINGDKKLSFSNDGGVYPVQVDMTRVNPAHAFAEERVGGSKVQKLDAGQDGGEDNLAAYSPVTLGRDGGIINVAGQNYVGDHFNYAGDMMEEKVDGGVDQN